LAASCCKVGWDGIAGYVSAFLLCNTADLEQNWGWACEQIVAIDVVTANGDEIRVDSENHPDLLWAAKGAGPGFPAVVTAFHLRVRPKLKCMRSSTFIYPLAKYRDVMAWVVAVAPEYDDGTEIVAVAAYLESHAQTCIMAHFVTFKNSEVASEEALAKCNRERPDGFLDELVNKETSLAKEYTDQANANPSGHRYCVDNGYVSNEADVAAVLEPAFTTMPSKQTFALWYAMAPGSRRELPDMALSMQSDHYFAIYSIWPDEADDLRCQSWVRSVMKTIAPECVGAYLGDSDFQVRQTKFWTDEKAARLMQLRQKWDPEGRICGYLDHDDQAGVAGLENKSQWCNGY
jgi:FAD/FMN-containing dehydrogenase